MSFIPESIMSFLNDHYKLSVEEISFYTQNKFIKLKQVLNEETISFFSNHIKKRVEELSAGKKSLEERDTYGMAFLQVFNLWREDDIIKEFVWRRSIIESRYII